MKYLAAFLAVVVGALAFASASPTFSVIPLPYAQDALEPAISNRTVSFHYGKHVATYVANLNDALKNLSSSAASKDETLSSSIKSAGDNKTSTAVRNNGGGAWNHFLYFNQLRPHNGGSSAKMPRELEREIDLSFGSYSEMIKKLEAASLGVFGSGWAWLVATGDKAKPLAVETTPNQDNPLMKKLGYSGHVPILGIDVWVRRSGRRTRRGARRRRRRSSVAETGGRGRRGLPRLCRLPGLSENPSFLSSCFFIRSQVLYNVKSSTH